LLATIFPVSLRATDLASSHQQAFVLPSG